VKVNFYGRVSIYQKGDRTDEKTFQWTTDRSKIKGSRCPVGPIQTPLNIDGYDVPSDWYLRVGREAQKMLDGRIALTPDLPIDPENP